MISIEIDDKIYHVQEGSNVLQACLSLGLDLPYFCWHPSMGSIGACRQCAVIQYTDRHNEDDSIDRDEQGRIVMGCMTPVTESMRISIDADGATGFRRDMIELLMINHPHDCPVCEEGGECHLQDMTLMSGHTLRKYRSTKRTHRNQYLGPFINHEMNRCIACYRCVRFYGDYAGGSDLQVMASRNNVFFGRHEDGVLENEFSGNLVEVCPTGVFTDKPLSKHYSRKWDLQAAPSICVNCAQGCNTSPGERYGSVRRIVNRYNGEVNGYFLCDRGRFGYDFVNNKNRVDSVKQFRPATNGADVCTTFNRSETRAALVDVLANNNKLVGIGSPRASVEANFALRELVGSDNFFAGVNDKLHALMKQILAIYASFPVNIPTLKAIENADAVLVLGEDVMNTSPRMALSLRQTSRNEAKKIADELRIPRWQDHAVREAAQDAKTPIFIASVSSTRIDDIAESCFYGTPDQIARFGFAVAHAIDSTAPAEKGLSDQQNKLAKTVAATLKAAKKPLVISGTGSYSAAVIQAAANITLALEKSGTGAETPDLYYCLPESNSLGLSLLADESGNGSLGDALDRLQAHDVDALIVLEGDLSRQLTQSQISAVFSGQQKVIVIDHLAHSAARQADLILPAGSFAEAGGTLVSSEGRAQRYFSVMPPENDVRPSWEWLSDMIALRKEQQEPPWEHLDQVTAACASQIEGLKGIAAAAPMADLRLKGMKIARQPHRYSGRTAMLADVKVAEPRQPQDADSALAYSMEGFPGETPPSLKPFYWSPGWNSNQSVGKFQQEVNGPLKSGDPGIRIISTNNDKSAEWFKTDDVPEKMADSRLWLILPKYEIFGSEELSSLSPAIIERIPQPYALMSPESANQLGVCEGDGVLVSVGERAISLMVKIEPNVPSQAVCLPAGFPATAGIAFGDKGKVSKDPNWVVQEAPELIASDQGAQP